jgi:hypothetical protein
VGQEIYLTRETPGGYFNGLRYERFSAGDRASRLVFTLAGILAFEIGTVGLTMKRDEILRVGRVDNWYGILAGVIIVVGFVRATIASKGWAYTRSTYSSGQRSRPSSWSPCSLWSQRWR